VARYWTGTVTLPTDGSAVPVCRVGAAGCVIYDPTSAGVQVYVGGPDVTSGQGLPVVSAGTTFIPGGVALLPPVVPASTEDASLVLYACTAPGKTSTVSWLSVLPPPGGP